MDMIKNLIETLYWFVQPGNWGTIAAVAGGLGFVIFVHELGHFLAAKSCGVRCDKFYIGFDMPLGKLLDWVISLPLRLFKRDAQISFFQKFIPSSLFKYKKGETLYGIGIIPLGGYVKMLGQEDNPAMAAEEMKILEQQRKNGTPTDPNAPQLSPQRIAELTDPRSYVTKTVPQRMLIITAGVIMNVIFAFIMATVAYLYGVKQPPAEIGFAAPGGAAWEANIRPGSKVVKINNEPVKYFDDLTSHIIFSSSDDRESGIPFEIVDENDPAKTQTVLIKPRKENLRPMIRVGLATEPKLVFPDKEADRKDFPNADLVGKVIANPEGTTGSDKLPAPSEKLLRLKDNDELVSINGKKVTTTNEINTELLKVADQEIKIVVKSEIPAETKEAKPTPFWMEFTVPRLAQRDIGIVLTLGPITSLQQNSPAASAGLAVGDRIVAIDKTPVGDPYLLDKRLQQKAGQSVTLTVERPTEKKDEKKAAETEKESKTEKFETVEIAIKPRTFTALEETLDGVVLTSFGAHCRVDPIVQSVQADTSAAKNNIKPGDRIVSVRLGEPAEVPPGKLFRKKSEVMTLASDDFKVFPNSWTSFRESLQRTDPTRKVELKIQRTNDKDAKDDEWTVVEPFNSKDEFVTDHGLHFSPKLIPVELTSSFEAVELGAKETWNKLTQVVRFLKRLRDNDISAKALGGPVTIAQTAGMAATSGFAPLLLFLTMLSANLAVVNILPVPVLDGGHVVFLLYEGITGKPPNARVFEFLTMIGFLCLLSLMLFVLGLDFGFISRK